MDYIDILKKDLTIKSKVEHYPDGANSPTIITKYKCLCGKGEIVEENTIGFNDHFVSLECDECLKKYAPFIDMIGNRFRFYKNQDKSLKIRVATYNVGDFSGVGFNNGDNKGITEIKKALSLVDADIIGLQEDVEKYGDNFPRDVIYNDYPYYNHCGNKRFNYKAFLTKYEVKNVKQIEYVGEMKFAHPWFLTGTLTLDEKNICLISLHFDWTDKFVRAEEIRQVIKYAKQHKYCIVMGDFNTTDYINKVKQSENSLFTEETSIFMKEGFKTANGGKFGTFNTYLEHVNHYPLDNILVWGNIKIENVGMHLAEYMNDHAILWADLVIK